MRLALALLFLWPVLGLAQSGLETARGALALEEAVAQLERAERAGPDARLRAYGQALRGFETALEALRSEQRRLSLSEEVLVAELAASEEQIARFLSALQRIEASPAPLLRLHPQGPDGAARAGTLLANVVPALSAVSEDLAADLAMISAAREEQESVTQALNEALAGLRTAETALIEGITRRNTVVPPPDPTLAELGRSLGGDMTALVTQLGALPVVTEGAGQRPPYPPPVIGRQVGSYGAQTAAGPREGILLQARSGTVITAPFDASVRYSGPFQGYGGVVILEPQRDVLLILAGLSDVRITAGDVVFQNDPIATLAPIAGSDEVFLITSEGGDGPLGEAVLYIELRQDGVSVDPTPLFGEE